jgi:hypothetical protein
VQTSSLRVSVSGAGSINITNVAAGGDLGLVQAATTNGDVNLAVAGGNLTLNTTGLPTGISAPGHTVTLNATGDITAPNFALVAAKLAVTGALGIGTSANPLEMNVDKFAAHAGADGVFIDDIANTVVMGTVGNLLGVTANGQIFISTAGGFRIGQPINANGSPVNILGNGDLTINPFITIDGSSATVKAGSGVSVFTVFTLSATTPLTLIGGSGTPTTSNLLIFDVGHQVLISSPGKFTVGSGHLLFSQFDHTQVNNAAAVDTLYGPDTADRATALAGLDSNHRYVQVLYLNALGRIGSMAELNSWVNILGAPNGRALVATGIEQSLEARQHLVKSWFRAFLGRNATAVDITVPVNSLKQGGTEEQVLSGILGTPEFFQRAQLLVTTGTANERFVQALFLLLLNRMGTPAEVTAEANMLATISRQQLALDFMTMGTLGTEFRTDLVDAYYEVLLHRIADSGGLNGWVNSGSSAGAIRIGFDSSQEFFLVG